MAKAEVIAMLMPEAEASGRGKQMATLLVRNPDGQMSLQTVSADSTLGQYAMSTGCFRQGAPIVDPVTREVLGYEMEMIPSPLARFG
jgi:hypothetical protein